MLFIINKKLRASPHMMKPDRNKEMIMLAGGILTPLIFLKLIELDEFDIERHEDIDYINSIMRDSNLIKKVLGEIEMTSSFHDEFIDLAKYSVQQNKKNSAIILIATAIEHKLNYFYRCIYKSKSLHEDDITKKIRYKNFYEKTEELMLDATGTSFPTSLRDKLRNIANLRNDLVHHKYHFKKVIGDSSDYFPKNEVNEINFTDTFDLLNDLEEYTNNLLNEKIEARQLALKASFTYENQAKIK